MQGNVLTFANYCFEFGLEKGLIVNKDFLDIFFLLKTNYTMNFIMTEQQDVFK